MTGKSKTKEQLIKELDKLRRQVKNYKKSGVKSGQTENNSNKFRILRGSIPEAFTVTDLNGTIIECNKNTLVLHGFTEKEELLGKSAFELIVPKDRKTVAENMKKTLEQGETTNLEYTFLKRDGSEFPAELSVRIIKDTSGKPVYFTAVTKDISSRKRAEEKLRVSEERFRALTVCTSDWIWEVDADGVYTYAGPKVMDILGYEPEEVIGMTPFDLMDPDEAERMGVIFRDIAAARRSFERLENTNLHKDGRRVVLETSGVPIFDTCGNFKGYRGIDRDITERKQAELEREQRIHRMGKRIKEITCMYKVGRLIRKSNSKEEIFCGAAEIIHTGWQYTEDTCVRVRFDEKEYVSEPFEPTQWKQSAGIVIDGKNRGSIEVYYLNEHPLCFEGPFREEERQLIDSIAQAFSEAIKRKQAEEALKESEEKFRTFMETASDLMHIADKDGNFTYVNNAMSEILGYSKEEMIGMHITQVLSKETLGKTFKLKLKELITKGEISLNPVWVTNAGEEIHGEVKVVAIYDKEGNFAGSRGVLRDITEHIKMEKELKKAVRVKLKFTSMVSHELRTPLTAIKEGIGIVLDGSAGEINEEQRDFLDTAKRNVDRLHRLIDDVLDFTKLNSKKTGLNIQESSINKVINEVVKTHKTAIREKDLIIKTELSPDTGTLRFDYDGIARVVSNLINNAVKFTEKGEITIKSSKDDNEKVIKVSVKDTGAGIRKRDIQKLFQEFQQAGGSRYRRPGSTGLGLAICREIVEQHGGKVWVESTKNNGSEFIFTLPAGS